MSNNTEPTIAGFSTAYIEEACNFLSTMSEVELDDAGPEYQRLFGYALALRGAMRQFEAALDQSVEVIKVWYNMDIRSRVINKHSDLWDIYYRNAPEMALIRAALAGRRAGTNPEAS